VIRPLSDNVVLVDRETARVTPGGIVIPDTAESPWGKNLIECEVLSVGPGGYGYAQQFDEMPGKRKLKFYSCDGVNVGDRVLVNKFAGETLVVGDDVAPKYAEEFEAGQELRIVRSSEIVGVIES
jgi:co-chaperonin GroES (HSP10)